MAYILDAAFADDINTSISYDDDSIFSARGGGMGKFAGMEDSRGGGAGGGTGGGTGGGLGSLADELAGAMYDEEEEYDEDGEDGDGGGGEGGEVADQVNGGGGRLVGGGIGTSEYGADDAEDPTTGISLALEDKINQVEELAVWNKMMMNEEENEVIPRLMEGLQRLPPQSSLEGASNILITAHTNFSVDIFNQTFALRDLSLSITSASPPDPETYDLLLPLADLIPRPTRQPLEELAALHSTTLSLISHLSFLSDSLHMARQSSIAASRKLRVAREACAEYKSELELVERSRQWIEDGDWDARCRRREAAAICAEVTGGFEDVCRGFEERLLKAQSIVS